MTKLNLVQLLNGTIASGPLFVNKVTEKCLTSTWH